MRAQVETNSSMIWEALDSSNPFFAGTAKRSMFHVIHHVPFLIGSPL